MKKIFITGTDTGVGKTHVTCGLIKALQLAHKRVIGVKPVASGAQRQNGQWCNEDALAIQTSMANALPYAQINPFCFEPAIAPHIAAEQANVELSCAALLSSLQWLNHAAGDIALVEGAGGWLVPLNAQQTFADFAEMFCDGVILVVAMRLGCINHARLTAREIQRSGLPLVGWVANSVQPQMPYYKENLRYLESHLTVPLLAELSYQQTELMLLNGTLERVFA